MVARALCGSSAASWSRCTRLLQLWRRQISCEARLLAPPRGFRRMAFASPLRIAYVHFATRAIARATALLHRKIVFTSRAKMYQAPPRGGRTSFRRCVIITILHSSLHMYIHAVHGLQWFTLHSSLHKYIHIVRAYNIE